MSKLVDLTGKRFGRLVVLRRGEDYIAPSGAVSVRWVCKCDCGKEVLIGRSGLQFGSYKSCGCYRSSVRGMEYENKGDYILCKCNQGEFLIDTEDFDLVKTHGWHITKLGYVAENRTKKFLHTMIMKTPKGRVTDHINGNPLDNRKSNLRVVGFSENGYNKVLMTGKSGEPFISYNKSNNYYCVTVDGKYRGGSYDLEKAKEIRDRALVGSKVAKYNRFLQ